MGLRGFFLCELYLSLSYVFLSKSFNLTCKRVPFFLSAWLLKMRPTGHPETSVQNYRSTMRKIPVERKSNLRHGGILKSRKVDQDFGA